MSPLILNGMHGLGDNLHERAIVRELMRHNEVWFKTSWPQIFWDMERELHLLPLNSPIGWMAKNEARSVALYCRTQPPPGARVVSNGYLSGMPQGIKDFGSVLGMMANVCGLQTVGDFRMPIAPAWDMKADALLAEIKPTKPLMIYRPPIAIAEANRLSAQAKVARNPDLDAYRALVSQIRDRYFVLSLADVTLVERLLDSPFKADMEFHHGELDFETIAALFARAALVFTSPCFATVLAQAVGAPMVCVFGGFEGKESFSAGGRYSPWLPIEPINPCACWEPTCKHDKTIDVPAAHARIAQFIVEHPCKSC